jgi:hypothetical protein
MLMQYIMMQQQAAMMNPYSFGMGGVGGMQNGMGLVGGLAI